jgi:hypothetical protein
LDEFTVYFNKKRQWITVHLWDVNPNTFQNWKAGRWGYFIAKWDNPRIGLFGEVHLVKSRVREDLVVHEMFHVLCEIMWSNRDSITGRNEEKYCEILDQLVGNFYKEYRKLK